MTAPPCVTTPCQRCDQPHPETQTRGYQRLDANGWHAWQPPDLDATSARMLNELPDGWTRILGGLVAVCAVCRALVDNQHADISHHAEWHQRTETP